MSVRQVGQSLSNGLAIYLPMYRKNKADSFVCLEMIVYRHKSSRTLF